MQKRGIKGDTQGFLSPRPKLVIWGGGGGRGIKRFHPFFSEVETDGGRGRELLMVFGLTKWRMPSLGALNYYAYFAAP